MTFTSPGQFQKQKYKMNFLQKYKYKYKNTKLMQFFPMIFQHRFKSGVYLVLFLLSEFLRCISFYWCKVTKCVVILFSVHLYLHICIYVFVPWISFVAFLFMSYDVSKQFLWLGCCRIRPLFYSCLCSECDDGTFSFISPTNTISFTQDWNMRYATKSKHWLRWIQCDLYQCIAMVIDAL